MSSKLKVYHIDRTAMNAPIQQARDEGGRRCRGIPPFDERCRPTVSIVTVVRNAAAVLDRAMRSVLNQGYPSLEYIVVDGGSSDGTLKIIHDHQHNLDYWVSEPDAGISDAMNKGISLCTGEIIGLVHADDWLEPGSIARVAEAFAADNSLDVVYGMMHYRDETGGLVETMPANHNLLDDAMTINHPATFVRRSAYDRFGVFDCTYKLAMDYELFLRMYRGGAKFAYLPQALANMSLRGASDVNWCSALWEVKRSQDLYFSSLRNHGIFLAAVFRRIVGTSLKSLGLKSIVQWYHRNFTRKPAA